MTPRPHYAILGLAAIIIITIGWWVSALWPLPASTPEWVARARAACFGDTETGMPNAGGWILLIGTPLSMLAALAMILPGELREGLSRLRRAGAGRRLMATTGVLLIALATLAGVRIANAYGWTARAEAEPDSAPRAFVRTPPETRLIGHRGDIVDIADLRGRPAVVTFAYGKCETVCPTLVFSALEGAAGAPQADASVVIITLDPWRDTPSRLPGIAESWGLGPDDHLLGGDVATVSAILNRWEIERSRDDRTGEIAHASLAYILDAEGRIAYATTGSARQIADALGLVAPASAGRTGITARAAPDHEHTGGHQHGAGEAHELEGAHEHEDGSEHEGAMGTHR